MMGAQHFILLNFSIACLLNEINSTMLQLDAYTTLSVEPNCLTEICFPAYQKSIYILPIVTYENMCNATMCITKQEEEELGGYLKSKFFSRLGRYEYILGNCSQGYTKPKPLFVVKEPPTATTQVPNVQIPIQTQVDGPLLVQTILVSNHLLQPMRETMNSSPPVTRLPNNDNLQISGRFQSLTATSTLVTMENMPTEAVMNPNTAAQAAGTQGVTTTSNSVEILQSLPIHIPLFLFMLNL
ncbi:hypothetical protein HDV06_000666 [Boothiomyces sp. JEL0866]|nr:hypothetical protein HDV06_000666 [Boothiomyces sp. JEL0866]